MEENKMMVAQDLQMEGNENFIADLTAKRVTAYTSIVANTIEEKKKFFNAVNSTEKRIGDCINKTIAIKDVYVEVVQCTNKETGEVQDCPRTVLVDEKGVSYQAVSKGVFNGLKKLFQVFGMPNEWEKPLSVEINQVTRGERKILTLVCK